MADNNQSTEVAFHASASLDEQAIARVYADALYDAAAKKNQVGEVKEQLRELVHVVFQQDRDFEEFLASAVIGRDHKKKVITTVFEERGGELFFNFLMVLAEHDRLDVLRTIQFAFEKIDDERNRRMRVIVQSAVPLSEAQTNRLREDLHDTFALEPVLHQTVDPELLGGLIVRVADSVFDRSVRSELTNIRKQLIARRNHVIQSGRNKVLADEGN